MDQEDHTTDPFSSHGLWSVSRFTLQSLQPLEPLPWDEELPDLSGGFFKSPLNIFDKYASELPGLSTFGPDLFDPDQTLGFTTDTSSESQSNVNPDKHSVQEDDVEDIWALGSFDIKQDCEDLLKSWEKYHDRSSREPVPAYFSESGAKGFDAALARQAAKWGTQTQRFMVQEDVFFQALLRLGLGWSSLFFRYNEQKRQFEQVHNEIRISGITSTALNGLTEELLRCGTNMQRIRIFVGKVPTKSNELSALSAFSGAAGVVVHTLEKQLVGRFRSITSLLQVKALFHECGTVVSVLANMVSAVDGAVSEAQIVSVVSERAAHFTQIFDHMEALLREIVIRVTEPWLTHVETWVGLRPETSTSVELASSGRSFVAVESQVDSKKALSKTPRVDYRYMPDQMPSFIPTDQASLIFESGRSLRLLKRNHPQHPVANQEMRDAHTPKLECASTWFDIERIQRKASEYEAELRSEILKYNRGEYCRGPGATPHTEGSWNAEEHQVLTGTFELFDLDDVPNATGLLRKDGNSEKDKLGHLLDENPGLESSAAQSGFGPELASSFYLSLAPLLTSQALLIDFSCLHLLFKEHHLRSHLTLQWRFQLLGDGFFTSRLSNSLFDPDMESGERKVGVVRSDVHAGLRLGSRDTWPPASSELRLVLIGLLNECHNADKHLEIPTHVDRGNEKELPGGLSFSIRDLSDDEIAKCKDPNAIEALDFLRLQYKPSAVLETILTQRSLNKYDLLFKHLLRLLRMVSVVKRLIRDSTVRGSQSGDTRNVLQKFRIDSQHFVLAISDYCFHVGVGSTWRRFQDALSKIESCLDHGDIDGTIEAAHSVPRLRDHHEDVLDQMLYALFQSKKHNEVAKLLDDIFGTILTFAPLSQLDGVEGVRHETEAAVRRLYSLFRKQTSAFVGYLRGIEGVKTTSKSLDRSGMAFIPREAPITVFDHLLARLEMKRYY
ncbi:hypothetical protein BO94DRAFT_509690 [Aspergillus sclerotioniger CBS 115572]|uniref:Spindle pole body component n=1 Tax=Aspergillus sclerotioniger CBS 115572 TaxID=1450535 RepID=A0A317XB37_9EURO|nr:hypothetical protein BO94DRAFT_509690 [Aspergillus sclerotioniger CBS 115572]PWY94872.1 hypothetical protein BO94DRAFT_509690 [Aspergillus sclerotioniger CBS 115572]